MKSKTKHYSIRRYLTFHIVGWALAMTIIPAVWVYYDTAKEVEELFDASLAQSARVLHGMTSQDTIEKHRDSLTEALLNKECSDGVDCPDYKHHENRRTEFKVLNQ